MMIKRLTAFLLVCFTLQGCWNKKVEQKGFQVREISVDQDGKKVVGLNLDSLDLETKPRNVLLTKHASHRITPIYKVNYNKKGEPYTGSNRFHGNWVDDNRGKNNWNNNFMPGFEAVYGYNMINVSHYDKDTNAHNLFFDAPVLIRTLYYPAYSEDTLNYEPVSRNYYMVSVYDEDTDNDGFITIKDLRRFYRFDIHGKMVGPLIPKNYSVLSSEYDRENDYMYIYAMEDMNSNGKMDQDESIDIFWIDLADPKRTGLIYHKAD